MLHYLIRINKKEVYYILLNIFFPLEYHTRIVTLGEAKYLICCLYLYVIIIFKLREMIFSHNTHRT